jgi:hypothetical protein
MCNVPDSMIDAVLKELKRRERSGAWLAKQIGVSRMSMSRWLRKTESLPLDREKQIAAVLDIQRTNERSQRGKGKA